MFVLLWRQRRRLETLELSQESTFIRGCEGPARRAERGTDFQRAGAADRRESCSQDCCLLDQLKPNQLTTSAQDGLPSTRRLVQPVFLFLLLVSNQHKHNPPQADEGSPALIQHSSTLHNSSRLSVHHQGTPFSPPSNHHPSTFLRAPPPSIPLFSIPLGSPAVGSAGCGPAVPPSPERAVLDPVQAGREVWGEPEGCRHAGLGGGGGGQVG